MKEKADFDITYCEGKDCKEKCWRHKDSFEFEKNKCYSFMERCIENEKYTD